MRKFFRYAAYTVAVCAAAAALLTVITVLACTDFLRIAESGYEDQSERGNARFQAGLGSAYLTGQEEIRTGGRFRQDNKKALFWLGTAAKSGYVSAYGNYAEALRRDGQFERASEWQKKADAHKSSE